MQELEIMSQEQLKEYLQAELDAENPDRTVVLKILELLKERDPVKEIPTETYESWVKFQKECDKPRRSAWKAWIGIGAAAAVLALILFVVPPAFGAENIFRLVGRWTDSVFSFGEDSDQTDIEYKTDHEGLQQVHDVVQDMGITANVVPTWLPKEYKLDEIITQACPAGEMVVASFTNEDRYITYKVEMIAGDLSAEYQKDASGVDVIEHLGVTYYIVSNDSRWTAMWSIENVACSITVDDYSILETIISSIYGKEN